MVEYIATIAEQNEHIMALIAVGSGSYGYNDEFSDIDMVIAIDNDANLDLVMNDVSASIGKQMKLIYLKQASQIRMQVYVGENYLEIDIGYGVYTGAAAMRKDWKVLFDKTGTVDAAMRRS